MLENPVRRRDMLTHLRVDVEGVGFLCVLRDEDSLTEGPVNARTVVELLMGRESAAATPQSNIVAFRPGAESARGQMLEALYREFSPALERFIRVRLVAEAERDDVLQAVFLKLARIEDLPEKLASRPDTVLSYLFTVTINVIRDSARRAAVRQKKHHFTLDDQACHSEDPEPDSLLEAHQDGAAVRAALKSMKKKHRQAFILSRFKGLSYKETANAMGVSVSTVEKYISAALLNLRKELLQ